MSHHFSQQAATHFQEVIAAEIVNPEDYYFLIEGKDSGIHECEVAKRVAEERQIPIDDPIFNPFQPAVIELYLASARAMRMPREILIGQLAGRLANARGTIDLDEVATLLGVASSQELSRYMSLAVAEKRKDAESYAARSNRMFDDLTHISNVLSAQVLDYYLRQHPNKKQVVLYLGKGHEETVGMDLSQIPETMRLNDSQIEELLRSRELARVAQILRALGIKPSQEEEDAPFFESESPEVSIEPIRMPTKKDRLAQILGEMSPLPEAIRTIIQELSDNLFGLEYVRRIGYAEYLNRESSLHQIWGAAAWLAEFVEAATSENRDLTSEEIATIAGAFQQAAAARRKDGYVGEADKIEELSRNVDILAAISIRLKS